jgi:hypothetical protein
MDGYDNPITMVPWPMQRQVSDCGMRPPAGTRIISVDDHGIEEMHLWENRLRGADRDRAPKKYSRCWGRRMQPRLWGGWRLGCGSYSKKNVLF